MLKLEMDQLTRQGIDAVRLGNIAAGEGLLQQAVAHDPNNALAWHWLASIAPNAAEKRRRLERVLEIDPQHAFARRDLAELEGKEPQAPRNAFTRVSPAAQNPLTTTLPPASRAPIATSMFPAAPLRAPAGGVRPEAGQAAARPPQAAVAKPGGLNGATGGTRAPDAQGRVEAGGSVRRDAGSGLRSALVGGAIGAAAALTPAIVAAPGRIPGAARPAAPLGAAPARTTAMPVMPGAARAPQAGTAAPPGAATAGAPASTAAGPASAASGASAGLGGATGAVRTPVGGSGAPLGMGERPVGAAGSTTIDDVIAVADQHVPGLPGTSAAVPIPLRERISCHLPDDRNRALMLVAAGIFCAALIGALVSRQIHMTQARMRAGQAGALTGLATNGKASTIHTPNGAFEVPGTGFLTAATRQNISKQPGDVIPLWPEPFNPRGTPACSLLHASGVLLLETRTSSAQSRAFKVENRGCVGWVDESELSATHPDAVATPADSKRWNPGK